MLYAALLFTAMVLLGGVLIGFSDTLYDRALNRWGRYELHWEFDRPLPGPTRFWTRTGSLRYLNRMFDETEDKFYIVDLETKEEFDE